MPTKTFNVRITGDAAALQRAFKQADSHVDRFARGMSRLRLPILAAAGAAAKMSADFDTAMSKIVGLVGIADDEVEAMGESVRALAGNVARSPVELADALYFVTSAGLRGDKAMQALEVSAKAAAAGLGDTKTVADAVTSAMNAYARSGLTAEEATDVLVATVREGKVEADELAGSIGRVLPLASEMGVSFNDVGGALASMTRLGLDANESVTALRGVLATLAKPTAQAADELGKVGLSAQGLRDELQSEGLLAVLQTLAVAFADNEEGLTKVIPNVRALTGFLNLTGQSAEEAEGIFSRMADTTGALDAAFGEASDTIEFRFNQALANLKERALEARDPLTRFLGQTTPLLSGMRHEMILAHRGINAFRDGVVTAEDPLDRFAQALRYVGGRTQSDAEALNLMVTELVDASDLLQRVEKDQNAFADAAGLTRAELDLLISVLEPLARIQRLQNEESEEGARLWSRYARYVGDAAAASQDFAVRGDLADDPLVRIGAHAIAAAGGLRSLAQAQLELVDPAFRQLQAEGRLRSAQQERNDLLKDGKASAQEIEDANFRVLEAQAELNVVTEDTTRKVGGDLVPAFEELARQAGIIDEHWANTYRSIRDTANLRFVFPEGFIPEGSNPADPVTRRQSLDALNDRLSAIGNERVK